MDDLLQRQTPDIVHSSWCQLASIVRSGAECAPENFLAISQLSARHTKVSLTACLILPAAATRSAQPQGLHSIPDDMVH